MQFDKAKSNATKTDRREGKTRGREEGRRNHPNCLIHRGPPPPRRGYPLRSGASHTENVPLLVKSLFRMLLKKC